jgi:hypothetical protein
MQDAGAGAGRTIHALSRHDAVIPHALPPFDSAYKPLRRDLCILFPLEALQIKSPP